MWHLLHVHNVSLPIIAANLPFLVIPSCSTLCSGEMSLASCGTVDLLHSIAIEMCQGSVWKAC